MSRRLLPYEHELIKALKVTEDEYLDFLAAQHDYSQSLSERSSELRAEPVSTVALVLTVIGIIFQVAAALVAKPDQKNQRQRRQERFSPRFGFNSSQELAQYGDTINLVYTSTKDNNLGGVRVATSLVWSSVESFGSSQFTQLLLVLGAAKILELDATRFAFGQLSLRQVMPSKVWVYYDQNGRVKFNDRLLGDGRDPSRLDGTPSTDDVCKIRDGGRRLSGFSQAFSPTSMNVFGVYSPIPINVDIQERRTSGRMRSAPLGVKIRGDSWKVTNGRWRENDTFTLVFTKASNKKDNVAEEAAKNLRYQYVESLDPAATYKLGTALFRLKGISDSTNLDKNEVTAEFECLEAGRPPQTAYDQTKAWNYDSDDREAIEEAEAILSSGYEEQSRTGANILDTRPNVRINKVKEYYDSDDEKYNRVQTAGVRINFAGNNYRFEGSQTIRWETDIQDKDSEDFKEGSYTVDKAGSIAYTKRQLELFLADKPKISTKKLRESYDNDIEDLRKLRDWINGADDEIGDQLRKEAKKSGVIDQIRKEINAVEDKIDNNIGDRYGFKKDSNNQGLLKAQGTDLTKDGSKKVNQLLKDLEGLREQKDDLLSNDVSRQRKAWLEIIRSSNSQFRAFGKTYSGGILYVKRKLRDLKGEQTTDQRGVRAVRTYMRSLIQEKEEALKFAKYVTKNWDELQSSADDHFYTKCIVKTEEAVYQTTSTCDYVKLAIKCRVFRNLSGRAKKYGEQEAPNGFKLSDNGYKARMAFFKVLYKQTTAANWEALPAIFVTRRGADQDSFIGLDFKGSSPDKWEFKLRGITDMAAEIRANSIQTFAFIKNAGKRDRITHNANEFRFVGNLVPINSVLLRPDLEERGPVYTNEWDLFSTRSDSQLQASFDNGPEFTISAVTEQQLASIEGKYKNISMLALGVYSGLGMQDLRSITGYVTEGKESYRLDDNTGALTKSNRSTSWAPDIFADTVLDPEDGIGSSANPDGIDWDTLFLSKKFCRNSGLGTPLNMDGVIAELGNWRQFWVETAPYSLLEFGRISGRDTLLPAIPVRPNGRATREITISALFNQGNILEGSYKEEFIDYGTDVQDLIATIIYRETEFKDVFSRNASVTVSLKNVDESSAVRQTFDLSQYVTRRAQAILYGKLLCNQRHWVRRAIEFQTVPTDSPVAPGSFILVDIGLNTWDQLTTGVVLPEGALNTPLGTSIRAGTYSMLLYASGKPTVTLSGVQVTADGIAAKAAPYTGRLFVLGTTLDTKRVFRVTEVEMDEEGEVTVRGTEYPCQRDGPQLLSRIANFADGLFNIA